MNASKLAIPALCVGLLGVVGGVAASQAFKPAEKPAPVVNIAPAAETVTQTQTPTVAVVTPSATATTVAPKPVKSVKVAVPSKPKVATTSVAPKTVQRQAIVSEQPADPTPVETPAPVVTDGPKVKERPGQKPGNQLPEPPPAG